MGTLTLTTGVFTVLAIGALFAATMGLTLLAKTEMSVAGRISLAPQILLGLLAGVLFLFYHDDAMVSPRVERTVRDLFHLPDDVEVGRVHGGEKQPVCYQQSVYRRTTVQFTPEKFARYVASLDDRDVWRPVVPTHYEAEKSVVRFSDSALSWQTLPEPQWMGKQQLVWRIAGVDVRRGLAQCYEFSRVEQPGEGTETGSAVYTVAACNARARTKTPAGGGRVTAAIDSDKQRLSISLQFDSKPDYCNNRVTKWLNRALGYD